MKKMCEKIKKIYEKIKKIKERKKKRPKKKELIETVITIRTKDLSKEVKKLCGQNFLLVVLSLLGGVLTAWATIAQFGNQILDYFKDFANAKIPVLAIIPCAIGIAVIVLSIISIIRQFKTYSAVKFVNNIVKNQYDTEKNTAIFLIKDIFDNVPKMLVSWDEGWNSLFLPHCYYDPKLKDDDAIKKMKSYLAELLEIELADFEIYDDFTRNTYVAIKNNPVDKSMSRNNYRFYYVQFENTYRTRRFLNENMKYFSWKSLYELGNDTDTRLNNGDVISIISEFGLLSQSKVAFKEKKTGSYDITSRYSIIWRISKEGYYTPPDSGDVCGQDSETFPVDKNEILLNLSTINGYIDKLDISGRDSLCSADDRAVIRKANQVLPFTDIKVSTTGKVLKNLPFEELIDTVKKCDITYDISYENNKELDKEYDQDFRKLEKISNSGIKVELNIHIPVLPLDNEREITAMILEEIDRINPLEVKFFRPMPIGKMKGKEADSKRMQSFINSVNDIIGENGYKFKVSYDCSLATCTINTGSNGKIIQDCGMLRHKLGIDCDGKVYACIWGAYIQGFEGGNFENNPFYLGDLTKETMYDILTKSSTLKLLRDMEQMKAGCRVCAYINKIKGQEAQNEKTEAIEIMLEADDELKLF